MNNSLRPLTSQLARRRGDYGDVTGSFRVEETAIVHPDNTGNF
jgi:hypothetical protein